MRDRDDLTVHLGSKLMTLYHVGYICEDLAKVIVLSHSDVDVFGSVGSAVFRDPLDMRRNDRRFSDLLQLTRISRVSEGSIEIVISAGTWLTSALVPIVLHLATSRASQKAAAKIELNIRCTNPRVLPLVDEYVKGNFGDGPEALSVLFQRLNSIGVSVHPNGNSVYVLYSLVERYAARIEKTLLVRER